MLFSVHEAEFYNLNTDRFIATIQAESQFNQNAVGDHGTSIGVVQIHLPAHPDITKDEALDPFLSIAWMAKEWSLGREDEWSTYVRMFGDDTS